MTNRPYICQKDDNYAKKPSIKAISHCCLSTAEKEIHFSFFARKKPFGVVTSIDSLIFSAHRLTLYTTGAVTFAVGVGTATEYGRENGQLCTHSPRLKQH